jgi:cytochrome c biogenesis protein
MLGSARLAIALFFILAILSIFGTLIPQGQPMEFYLMKYGQSLGKLIHFFQLDDAYHSPWYIATLFLFMLNLTICSLNRLPFTIKLYKRNPAEVKVEALPNKIQFQVSNPLEKISSFIEKELKFTKIKDDLYYKRENSLAHFSVYVVHFSLIIIIIGALVGAIWGFRGNMSILEGEESNIVQPFRKKDPIQLDFKVRLNKFIFEKYPNGMPKEYISNVTIIDGNKTLAAIIKVNAPIKYKDVTFYQADYYVIPVFAFKFKINNKVYETNLSKLELFTTEDGLSIAITEYGQAHDYIYVKLWIVDEKEQEERQVLALMGSSGIQNASELPNMLCFDEVQGMFFCNTVEVGKHVIEAKLIDVASVMYVTVLQAKKDPGLVIVYVGFILMMLGLFFVYYFEPRIYWIYLTPKEDLVEISLGAYAKRDRAGIKIKLQELEDKIKERVQHG